MPTYNPHDKLMVQAKLMGFRARSVFKLEELDHKFQLLSPGMKVLDIGAAPGSWLQYASEALTPKGTILGLDLQQIEPIAENVKTEICDITDHQKLNEVLEKHRFQKVDLVISDIAPNTTGISYVDQIRSVELNKAIFEVSKKVLKPGGKLVMKVFPGEHFNKFLFELKSNFRNVAVQRVRASRESSREVYVVCKKGQH